MFLVRFDLAEADASVPADGDEAALLADECQEDFRAFLRDANPESR
jgi:hypothetical protein